MNFASTRVWVARRSKFCEGREPLAARSMHPLLTELSGDAAE